MAEAVTPSDIQIELIKIERQMDRVGGWSLRDRWLSGRLLIQLRDPETHYLPKGRLQTVAATLNKSTRELSDRMRVADVYRTDAAFTKAASGQTWTAVLRSLPATREARTGPTKRPKNVRQALYNTLAQALDTRGLTRDQRVLAQQIYDALEPDVETE